MHQPRVEDDETRKLVQALADFGHTPNSVRFQSLAGSLARRGDAWPAWIDFVISQLGVQGDASLVKALLSGDYVDRLVSTLRRDDALRRRLQHVVLLVAKALKRADAHTLSIDSIDPLADRLLAEAITDGCRRPAPLDAACEVQLNVLAATPQRGYIVPVRLRRLRLPEPHHGPGFRFVRAPWSALLEVDGEAPAEPLDADTFGSGLSLAAAAVLRRLRPDAEPVACTWDIGAPREAPLSALHGSSASAALAVAALYLLRNDLRDREQISSLRHLDWRTVAVSAGVANPRGDLRKVDDIDEKLFAWVKDRNSPFKPTVLFGHGDQVLGDLKLQQIFEGVPDLDTLVRRLGETAGDGLDADQHHLLALLCELGPPKVEGPLLTRVLARPVNGLWSWLLRAWAREWQAEPMPIGSFYVQLGLDLPPEPLRGAKPAKEGEPAPKPQTFTSLRQMLQSHGRKHRVKAWLVTGPPGCGKTVMLREHQLEMARQALQRLAAHEPPNEICVLVPMKDYQAANADAEAQLEALAQTGLAGESLRDLIQRYPGAVRVVFDGINEIGLDGAAPRTRQSALNDLMRWVLKMGEQITAPVFTNRDAERHLTIGTEGLKVEVAHVLPWDWDAQQAYCRLRLPEGDTAQRLIEALDVQPDIRTLCALPMNLSFQCELFEDLGRLALNRAELFSGIAWKRLRREYARTDADRQRLADLDALAPELERKFLRRQDEGWKDRIFDLPQGWLMHRLEAVGDALVRLHGRNERSIGMQALQQVLVPEDLPRFERLAANLGFGMLSDDLHRFQFAHQLWGEFFAARRLAKEAGKPGFRLPAGVARDPARVVPLAQALQDARTADRALALLEASAWEETVKLAAEVAPDAGPLIAVVAAVNPALGGRAAGLARATLGDQILEPLRQLLLRTSREDADLRVRVEAGLALGAVGDTLRYEKGEGPYGPYLVPNSQYWVTIEGGLYTIGSERAEGDANETPTTEVELQAFGLASHPVTNAEWDCFIQSGGYRDPQWWGEDESLAWFLNPQRRRVPHPYFWHNNRFNNASQPMVDLGFWEAQAYIRWLNAQTKGSARPGHDRQYRLPTEAEWEAAARGLDRNVFAWGNAPPDPDRCNFSGTRMDMTSPVGAFPRGDRCAQDGRALSDLTGNVLEWTSSRYTDRLDCGALTRATTDAEGDDVPRALRGGSWGTPTRFLRTAYRRPCVPGYVDDAEMGLRLAGVPIELARP